MKRTFDEPPKPKLSLEERRRMVVAAQDRIRDGQSVVDAAIAVGFAGANLYYQYASKFSLPTPKPATDVDAIAEAKLPPPVEEEYPVEGADKPLKPARASGKQGVPLLGASGSQAGSREARTPEGRTCDAGCRLIASPEMVEEPQVQTCNANQSERNGGVLPTEKRAEYQPGSEEARMQPQAQTRSAWHRHVVLESNLVRIEEHGDGVVVMTTKTINQPLTGAPIALSTAEHLLQCMLDGLNELRCIEP